MISFLTFGENKADDAHEILNLIKLLKTATNLEMLPAGNFRWHFKIIKCSFFIGIDFGFIGFNLLFKTNTVILRLHVF